MGGGWEADGWRTALARQESVVCSDLQHGDPVDDPVDDPMGFLPELPCCLELRDGRGCGLEREVPGVGGIRGGSGTGGGMRRTSLDCTSTGQCMYRMAPPQRG